MLKFGQPDHQPTTKTAHKCPQPDIKKRTVPWANHVYSLIGRTALANVEATPINFVMGRKSRQFIVWPPVGQQSNSRLQKPVWWLPSLDRNPPNLGSNRDEKMHPKAQSRTSNAIKPFKDSGKENPINISRIFKCTVREFSECSSTGSHSN